MLDNQAKLCEKAGILEEPKEEPEPTKHVVCKYLLVSGQLASFCRLTIVLLCLNFVSCCTQVRYAKKKLIMMTLWHLSANTDFAHRVGLER